MRRSRVGCKTCIHSIVIGLRKMCSKGEVNITFDYWNGEKTEYLTECKEKNKDGFCTMYEYNGATAV